MREILTIPNNVLRQECKPVKEIDSKIKALAKEMDDLMGVLHRGLIPIGIAAPQVGELLQMFIYRTNPYSKSPDATRVIINPTLTYSKKSVLLKESCLSIPGKQYLLKRYKIVKIKGMNIYGNHCSFRETGIIAQVFQHELNHLGGILIDEIGELV